MIDGPTSGEDAFAERIARPLRAPERPDATFEARAMSAVYAAARAEERSAGRSWWLRSRTVRLNPLASLALAAGFAGLVWAGASAVQSSRQADQSATAAQRDTVHVVRFVFHDLQARQVALVGAFNQWQKGATVLTAGSQPGVWTVDVALPTGRHEYAFIVTDERGQRWVADPLGFPVRDDFGTESSVIAVGASS